MTWAWDIGTLGLALDVNWPCEVSWVNSASPGSTTKVAQSAPSLSAYGSPAGQVAVARDAYLSAWSTKTNLIVVGPNIKPLHRDHVKVFCG